MNRFLIPASLAFTLFGTGMALADDDDCTSAIADWKPRDAAIAHVESLGIAVQRLKVDDGCYEMRGQDRDGNTVKLKIDPGTLLPIELDVRFRPGADPMRYLPDADNTATAPAAPSQTQGESPAETKN